MAEEPGKDGRGDTAALAAVLIVLLVIVFLFLLFKFNLFNGGTSIPTRTTAPSQSFTIRVSGGLLIVAPRGRMVTLN